MAHTHLVPVYRRLREASRALTNALVAAIPRELLQDSARALGCWDGARIALPSEHALDVLTDHCLHDLSLEGLPLFEALLRRLPPPASEDEAAVRAAMHAVRYGVYQVEAVEPGVGVVVHDIARGDRVFVVDLHMSQSVVRGVVYVGRLRPLPEFWMTTGALLPVSNPEDLDEVLEALGGESASEAAMRLEQPAVRTELTRLMLDLGADQRTQTRHASEHGGLLESVAPAPSVVRGGAKVGRNDPCPCGSGKKFKKCHGA